MPEKGLLYGYLMPLFTIFLMILLISISIAVVWYQTKVDTANVMVDEIAEDLT